MKKLLIVATAAMILSACGVSTPDIEVYTPENGETIAIMYIDMADAPTPAEWGWVRSFEPVDNKEKFQIFSKEDKKLGTILYAQKLKPGSYYVERVSGYNPGKAFVQWEQEATYRLGSEKSPSIKFKVSNQGVLYLGSYKYVKYKSKFGKDGDFSINSANAPTEKEVLTAFLDKADDKKVKKMIISNA